MLKDFIEIVDDAMPKLPQSAPGSPPNYGAFQHWTNDPPIAPVASQAFVSSMATGTEPVPLDTWVAQPGARDCEHTS